VIGCDNPLLEAEAAAHWCAEQLAHDATARLLLVVPRLERQRHLWERALSQRLDAPALLGAGTSSGASPFAIEGGLPLRAYPLVASALQLIEIATGPAPFEQLSAALRSRTSQRWTGINACGSTCGCVSTMWVRLTPACCPGCCRRCPQVLAPPPLRCCRRCLGGAACRPCRYADRLGATICAAAGALWLAGGAARQRRAADADAV